MRDARRSSRLRRLLRVGAVGALLGLLRDARSAHAANGDPIILGWKNVWLNHSTCIYGLYQDVILAVKATGAPGAPAILAKAAGWPPGEPDWSGEHGVAVYGGSWEHDGLCDGGFGIEAHGGAAETGSGGIGAFARGGSSQSGYGGTGLDAYGGEGTEYGGNGVTAYGGPATVQDVRDRSGGDGIWSFGGQSAGGPAGAGVYARGSTVVAGGAHGVTAVGGFDGLGAQALGVFAVGGGDPGLGASAVYGEAGLQGEAAVSGKGVGKADGVVGQAAGGGDGVVGWSSAGGPGGAFRSESDVGVTGTSVDAAGIEVQGYAEGISGRSKSGFGAFGQSTSGVGISGSSTKATGAYLQTDSASHAAAFAANTKATPAGGPVGLLVNGDCIVANGTKSAAVPTSRGLTLLYVVEAATSVFEDVGKVRLQNGRARVELDLHFAETIETADYQVFLTARGDTRGLYVATRDARGFEIREQAGGASSVDVNVRIVGRRKGLQPDHRLATTRAPAPPRPTAGRPSPLTLRRPKPPPSFPTPPPFRTPPPIRGSAPAARPSSLSGES